MRTRVVKWGNSLAVRIPKAYAGELGLVCEAEIDHAVGRGTIVLAPAAPNRVSLELLDKVTEENIHGEVETGRAVADEAW